MKTIEPRQKTCDECKKDYQCDKRWGKAKAEKSKTCSKSCQLKWVSKNRIRSGAIPRSQKPQMLPATKKFKDAKRMPTLVEFKEGLKKRAQFLVDIADSI